MSSAPRIPSTAKSVRLALAACVVGSSFAMIGHSGAATIIGLNANVGTSTSAGFGSSLPNTLTDGFAYDPLAPTAALPNGNFDASIAVGFHANESEGAPATLNYDLASGAYTVGTTEPVIVVDLYGRNEARFLGDPEPTNEAARDNDVDVILLLGGTEVASVEGVMIDGADGAHGRATFDALALGTQFDAIRLIGNDSVAGDGGNYFTLAETRVAAIPEPGVLALLGFAGLSLVIRRRR